MRIIRLDWFQLTTHASPSRELTVHGYLRPIEALRASRGASSSLYEQAGERILLLWVLARILRLDPTVSVIAISTLVCNLLPTTLHTKPYKEATVRRVHTIIIRIMRSMISNYEYTRRDRGIESGAGTSLF